MKVAQVTSSQIQAYQISEFPVGLDESTNYGAVGVTTYCFRKLTFVKG